MRALHFYARYIKKEKARKDLHLLSLQYLGIYYSFSTISRNSTTYLLQQHYLPHLLRLVP